MLEVVQALQVARLVEVLAAKEAKELPGVPVELREILGCTYTTDFHR